MYWEVFVDAGESCNKIIFERMDCTFRQVSSVQVGWNKLEEFFLLCHELLQNLGALVVQILHFWCKLAFRE